MAKTTILALLLAVLCPAMADTLVVDVHHFPPCVVVEEGSVTGFDIEVFEKVAKEAGLTYKYNVVDKFDLLFVRLVAEKSDVAVAGITINEQREKYLDFTHHYLKSGLLILIRKDSAVNVLRTLKSYFSSVWRALIIFALFLIVCSIIMWALERGKDSFDDRFWKGLGDGIYWTNTTITTVGYGDKTPLTAKGKVFAVFVMWVGICIIFPYVVAQMNQIMNSEVRYNIESEKDLRNQRVAAIGGTTSEDAVVKLGAILRSRPRIEDCYEMLRKKEVDAVVYDMPVLRELVQKTDEFVITGDLFDRQDYGIALRQGSGLREPINRALLKFMRSAEYRNLHKKWFNNIK